METTGQHRSSSNEDYSITDTQAKETAPSTSTGIECDSNMTNHTRLDEHSDTESLRKYKHANNDNSDDSNSYEARRRHRHSRSRTRSSYRFRRRYCDSDSDESTEESDHHSDAQEQQTDSSTAGQTTPTHNHYSRRQTRTNQKRRGRGYLNDRTTHNIDYVGRTRHRNTQFRNKSRPYQQNRYNNNHGTQSTARSQVSVNNNNSYDQQAQQNLSLGFGNYIAPEPYNPEDAIFNQHALLSHFSQFNLPSQNKNGNSDPVELRPRQLVNVSLVNDENEQQQQHGSAGQSNQQCSMADLKTRINNRDGDKSRRKAILLIKKIPVHLNRVDLLNDYFKKFGQIVAIKVAGQGLDERSALIQYAHAYEADQAYRCTDPIFDNRFIQVFWAKKDMCALLNEQPDQTPSPPSMNNSIMNNKRKQPTMNSTEHLAESQPNKRHEPSGPSPQQHQPMIHSNHKAMIEALRKRQFVAMKVRQQCEEFNRKLQELICNQKHLIKKFDELDGSQNNLVKKKNLKKLIQSNMDSVQEYKKKIETLQQSIKSVAK